MYGMSRMNSMYIDPQNESDETRKGVLISANDTICAFRCKQAGDDCIAFAKKPDGRCGFYDADAIADGGFTKVGPVYIQPAFKEYANLSPVFAEREFMFVDMDDEEFMTRRGMFASKDLTECKQKCAETRGNCTAFFMKADGTCAFFDAESVAKGGPTRVGKVYMNPEYSGKVHTEAVVPVTISPIEETGSSEPEPVDQVGTLPVDVLDDYPPVGPGAIPTDPPVAPTTKPSETTKAASTVAPVQTIIVPPDEPSPGFQITMNPSTIAMIVLLIALIGGGIYLINKKPAYAPPPMYYRR